MATKLITVLCEGPHDVAFLNRILKTRGFTAKEDKKLGDYPAPMGGFFKTSVAKTKVEELNFQEIRRILVPLNILTKDTTYLFLYALGGDSKTESRKSILNTLLSFIPKEEGEISVKPDDTELLLTYFLDADDKGVNQRIDEINSELEAIFNKPTIFKNNGETRQEGGIVFGNFIFTGDDNNTGNLEFII